MLLKETMLGASGTAIDARAADTGQAWNPWLNGGGHTPIWTTGSGTARPSTSGFVAAVLSASAPPSADEAVRFKVKIGSFMGSAVVVARAAGSDLASASFYQVQADATGGATIVWSAAKITGGTNTPIGSPVTGSGYTAGQTLDCTATVTGSSPATITLAVNGSPVLTVADSSSPFTAAGLVGFYLFNDLTSSDAAGLQLALFESPPEATGFTLTGVPGSVNVGSPITGTVTPDAPVGQSETVTVTDDLANTLGSVSFVLGDTAGKGFSFNAISGQLGARTITATPGPTLGTPPTASTTVTNPPATSYTLTDASPASGFVGNASANFTVQANGVPTTTLVVTPSAGSGGTFTPTSLTISDGSAHTFTYTPSTAGSKTISVGHTGGSGISGDPAPVSYSVGVALTYSSSFDFGAGYIGALASAGYTLISRATQAAIGSRVTSGVAVSSTDGTVSTVSILADPTVPFDVRWDSGGGSPVYGVDSFPAPPYSSSAAVDISAIVAAVVSALATAPVGSVAGDLGGKVLGGGSGTITGVGANTNTVDVNGEPIAAFDGVLQAFNSSGSTDVVTLAAGEPTGTTYGVGRLFETVGGTGPKQYAYGTAYDGSTKQLTLDRHVAVALDDTTEYSITVPQATGVVLDKAGYALTTAYDPAKTAAQASTALSNQTWTDARAGNIDAAISTRSTFAATAVLPTPRDISTAADNTITYNDALWSVVASAAGKETVSGVNYVVKTPAGTVVRTFTLTLDANQNPTARA